MINDINDFYILKHKEAQRVNFEMTYVDIAKGDVVAGLLLSQIVYWFTPTKEGRSRTKVTYKGRRALAKGREEWYDEIRITPRQYDRAIKILKEIGVVTVKNSMFNAKRTPFIMLNEDVLLALYNREIEQFNEKVTPILPNSNTEVNKTGIPLTETNTETNTETKIEKRDIRQDVNNSQLNQSKEDNNSLRKIERESVEVFELMPRKDINKKDFILIYKKMRLKYSREYLELIINRYKKIKELKGEYVYHKPDNFFKFGEYKKYLDENWESTLVKTKKNKSNKNNCKRKSPSSSEPDISDEWADEIDNVFK